MEADAIHRTHQSRAGGKVCLKISDFEQVGHCHRVRLKSYSSCIHIETYFPSFIAGMNLIFFAASTALPVSPSGRPETTRMLVTFPVADKTALRTTVPAISFRRASSV